jgi:hypothetical protein
VFGQRMDRLATTVWAAEIQGLCQGRNVCAKGSPREQGPAAPANVRNGCCCLPLGHSIL